MEEEKNNQTAEGNTSTPADNGQTPPPTPPQNPPETEETANSSQSLLPEDGLEVPAETPSETPSETPAENASPTAGQTSVPFTEDKPAVEPEANTGDIPTNGEASQPEDSSSDVQIKDSILGEPLATTDAQGDEKPPVPRGQNKDDDEAPEGSTSKSIFRTISIIIIILVAIWMIRGDDSSSEENHASNDENTNANIVVDDTKQEGDVVVIDATTDEIAGDVSGEQSQETTKIIAYYGKSGVTDCSLVYPVELEVEKKYESNIINTVRGLLFNLTAKEQAEGYVTAIPAGTYLKNVAIKDGTATVNLSGQLNDTAGACNATLARAQIEKTLLQFTYINAVEICVDDNCNPDEILQP